jgi:hypothetical protein
MVETSPAAVAPAAGGECVAQHEFGQDAEAGPGNQGRQLAMG